MNPYCTTQYVHFLSLPDFTLMFFSEMESVRVLMPCDLPQYLWDRLADRDQRAEHPWSTPFDHWYGAAYKG